MKTVWCIPPKQNAEFVAHMEDVLEVYSRPYNEKRPIICMGEKPFQLLDEMFTPAEAFRLIQKIEIHYTPEHGSWLDIAEIEPSALTIQCILGERIPSVESLNEIVSPWSLKRNSSQKGVSWHFTTENVRIRLKHLYPEIKL